ncbi:MAG: DUF655 domain-containing protein [Candidatus Aenigmarchaeota archaeon]|nr:DUF655 domain-containing protein [Candidatus Aenigmarchaeota archaeon]
MLKKDLKKDEWAFVLDFMLHGHQGMNRSQPVAQVIGEDYFSLLEVIVKEDSSLKVGERVYVGDGKRDLVKYIRKRLEINELSSGASGELEDMITSIIESKKEKFLEFFNKSGPISTRLHKLELLPGIGKKHLWAIIEARKEKDFDSFDDIKKRVPMMPDIEQLIAKRVMIELEDKDKYRIFVPKFESNYKSE